MRPGRRAALDWAARITASEQLSLYQQPRLDILTYFPTRTRLSQIDQASEHVLTHGMQIPPNQSLFVATYTVDAASLTTRGHQVDADVPNGRILRSVLMKPETAEHVPQCTSRSSTKATARAAQRRQVAARRASGLCGLFTIGGVVGA